MLKTWIIVLSIGCKIYVDGGNQSSYSAKSTVRSLVDYHWCDELEINDLTGLDSKISYISYGYNCC